MLTIRTLCIYVFKDERICGYFSKPEGVLQQKSLGNIGLEGLATRYGLGGPGIESR